MARFLLIGCTSTVGKNLVPRLIGDGHEVYGTRKESNCLISEPLHSCQSIDLLSSDLSEVIQRTKPEYLILASWITQPGIYLYSDDNTLWLNSYAQILDEFKRSGGRCVIGLGSCAEYYIPQPNKISETDLVLPDSAYGKAKIALLNRIKDSGLDYIWTRTFFQYAIDDPPGKFIKSAMLALNAGGEFHILDPLAERDFVYSDDVARVLHALITKQARGIFNIGTGQPYSNLKVVQIIHKKLGYRGSVRINGNPPQKTLICSTNTKLATTIGFDDWTTIQDGISLLIKDLTS